MTTSSLQVARSLRLPFRRADVWQPAIFGVPVAIEVSWLLGFALVAWTLADTILPMAAPGRPLSAYAMAGAAGGVLVLLSLALHEAGHCVAARRAGLSVTRVRLSLVGGACELGETPRSPATELRIAAAGPLASLACAVVATVAHVALVESDADPLAAAVTAAVAVGNVLFVLLNALPGLPLDGGRIARAALWAATGRELLATRITLVAGRVVATTLVGLALIASASGDAAAGLWCGLLGGILLQHD